MPDFLKQYRELYSGIVDHLNINQTAKKHLEDAGTSVERFAKNVLSQIAFLYFLQAKGWLHIPAPGKLKEDCIFNEFVQPAFAQLPCTNESGALVLPDILFRNKGCGILDVFDRYHFCVHENENGENDLIVSPETIGYAFESLPDLNERRHKGTFYTPTEIVKYMCRESISIYLGDKFPGAIRENADFFDRQLFNITVCDPAIGSGAFAIGMLDELVRVQLLLLPYLSEAYLQQKLQQLDVNGSTPGTTPTEYTNSLRRRAITQSIYGVDIDPCAIDVARLRMWLSLIAEESHADVLKTLPSLDHNIVAGNALTNFPFSRKFAIVTGNPPYGVYQGQRKDELAVIKTIPHFSMAKGQKLNAFELFLCMAPGITAPDTGIISMIFQNSFLADTSSKLLRQFYLKQKQIIKIDSFPERDDVNKRVFRSAKMSVCILFVRNAPAADGVFHLNIWRDRHFKDCTSATIDKDAVFKLDPKYYSIPSVSAKEYRLLQHLSSFSKLSGIAHCYEGEINLTFHREYLSEHQVEGYHTMIRGASIHRWHLVKKMSQGAQQFLSPAYLKEYATSGKASHYRHARLVLQGITGVGERFRLKFAVLGSNTFCGNSANYILFSDPRLTLPYMAILNSEVQNWFFKKYSTNSNVNGYEVDNLPVTDLSENEMVILQTIAEYLTWISNAGDHPMLFAFFDALNNAVNYELFFKKWFAEAGVSIIQSIGPLRPLHETMSDSGKLYIIQSAYELMNGEGHPVCEAMNNLHMIEPVIIIREALE